MVNRNSAKAKNAFLNWFRKSLIFMFVFIVAYNNIHCWHCNELVTWKLSVSFLSCSAIRPTPIIFARILEKLRRKSLTTWSSKEATVFYRATREGWCVVRLPLFNLDPFKAQRAASFVFRAKSVIYWQWGEMRAEAEGGVRFGVFTTTLLLGWFWTMAGGMWVVPRAQAHSQFFYLHFKA